MSTSEFIDILPTILIVDPIAPTALSKLRTSYHIIEQMQPPPGELVRLLQGVDAIVLRSGIRLTADVIEATDSLRVIARAGNGVDNIDLAAASRNGIQVFNLPSVSSSAVAELALGITFAVARKIVHADRRVRLSLWDKSALAGVELGGKSMGIIGLGRIGSHLAKLAIGIGMNVQASVDQYSPERHIRCQGEGITLTATRELLAHSDIVVVTCPLTHETRNLISEAELSTMRSSAILVNVARGEVLDEKALYFALADGRIAGAALDVHASGEITTQLAELDNVVLTPHIGAMSVDAQEEIGQLLVSGLAIALAGGDAPTRVC